VSRTRDLDPAGMQVTVRGSGFDTAKGIYVAFCVTPPRGAVPSPCGGGIDLDGSSGGSIWISDDPPPYGDGLAQPYGPGGSFAVSIRVTGTIGAVDCRTTSCAVVTRADHTRGSDRSQDVIVPVTFAAPAPPPQPPTRPEPPPPPEAPAPAATAPAGDGPTGTDAQPSTSTGDAPATEDVPASEDRTAAAVEEEVVEEPPVPPREPAGPLLTPDLRPDPAPLDLDALAAMEPPPEAEPSVEDTTTQGRPLATRATSEGASALWPALGAVLALAASLVVWRHRTRTGTQ
jgi:hypothetical protein